MHQTVWYSRQGPTDGFWGPVTASIDWCEENYVVSHYIAEFSNTLSNLFFVGLAAFSVIMGMREKLPLRYLLSAAGIALVGFGSFAFHGTLKYQTQLADEIPMLFASSLMTYVVFEDSIEGSKPKLGVWLPILCFSYPTLITIAYLIYPNPVLHQIGYACIQLNTTVRVTQILLTKLKANQRQLSLNHAIRRMELLGSASFVAGFVIWNMDNLLCDSLTDVKHAVGQPVSGILLEGHAWWHIGTGLGVFLINVSTSLMMLLLKDPNNAGYQLEYKLFGLLPYVARTQELKKSR
ncbi:uncharacterized protein L969DRAFT_25706 [Mixia osmundae IAM 14324]|uniref:Alkaline ceramidase n=1 Tax=Mixia osmundae (strain CBS 9802 / IAM 14324 / JCM 22182 / KY 12970) TaxID=764103 RepID=G7DUZ6_MIXOS|nr:uncharacterized protein L969DRAFT_25706 [Mixia osmundae IAM 14324]KEI37261.1 hypothetical protein L969DRAFT_25706 [Mixia osmundae IAM 14324]GAA94406.1 hypothetical protein E5Q_01058 [Mixia osmundae IAM 14324]